MLGGCSLRAFTCLLLTFCVPNSQGRSFSSGDGSTGPELRPSNTLNPRRLDEHICMPLLKPHISKVALMFLVRGDLPHEEVWTEWIGSLAGLVPYSVLCDSRVERCYRDMLERSSPPKSVYDKQTYFSIVVHTKPHFEGYESGSIFDGRIVDDRIETMWGGHSLVKAERLLMRAALQDPYNQRFQLVCEYSIPVRPALFTHQQLLAQNMSRVGEPNEKWETVEKAAFKWPLSMHEEWPELRHHTKSHSQWVTLIREHAQLVVDDTFVNDLYEKHCFQDEYLERRRTWCIPDEQYFGTLLSWKLEDDLAWQYTNDLAMAPVHDGDGVPPDQINTELLIQIRGSTLDTSRVPQYHIRHGECHAVERPVFQAALLELPRGEIEAECRKDAALREPPAYSDSPVYRNCAFFSRKFKQNTAPVVKKLLQSLVII